MFNFLPWRYKFWVVCESQLDVLTVMRARTNPVRCDFPWWYLVDGPFDNNEDVARSLAFWNRQLGMNESVEYDDSFCDDEEDDL